MKAPLDGLRVIELASVLAGPSAGQFFAELGAEVIKVENKKIRGDVTRSWLADGEKDKKGLSAYFSAVNWGKKSLALDLASTEGLEIIYRLAKSADIIIVSFKPGDDKKLQVDYETLNKINPGIIYGHITGYGLENNRAGYDAIIQAEAGFMYMNGAPGGSSMKMPVALMDILAAHQLKEGILVALLNRSAKKRGAYVHVSLFDAAVASLANQATNWLVAGKIPEKMGQEHPNIAPYGKTFLTKDGFTLLLAVGSDKQFKNLCSILKLDLAENERFEKNQNRVKNRDQLNLILEEAFQNFDKDFLEARFFEKAIPCGLINSMDQVFSHKKAEKMLLKAVSASLTGVRNIAFELVNDGLPIIDPPPSYGEHTYSILSDLHFSEEEITRLFDQGVVE